MPRYFRVLVIPRGEAPEWVRQAWVGLVLPLAEDMPEGSSAEGFVTGQSLGPTMGFSTRFLDAMEALDDNDEVRGWWLSNAHLGHVGGWLVFGPDECELVSTEEH